MKDVTIMAVWEPCASRAI